MLNQKEFLDKYRITEETFDKTKLKWSELEEIYNDHLDNSAELLINANSVAEHLRQIQDVHSLKIRIKDPEHLIEKIIRKKEKAPTREISLKNYRTNITDLIGVRALHLFKDDWLNIHEEISATWDFKEKPTAYYREGDNIKGFKENGCKAAKHPAGYRSVHYLVKFRPTKKDLIIAEIQVRTIFEEGWSEIDHRLRYPYDLDNQRLAEYLAIFNRYAGSADEMGTYIKGLKAELATYKEALEKYEDEKRKRIQDLEDVKKKLKNETAEKEKLQRVIDSLTKDEGPLARGIGSNVPGYAGAPLLSDIAANLLYSEKTCLNCRKKYRPSQTMVDFGECSECSAGNRFGIRRNKCSTCGQQYDPFTSTGPLINNQCGRCYQKSFTSTLDPFRKG